MDTVLLIIPFFTLILLGAVLAKSKVATPEWSTVLNKFALYLGFPALIFTALIKQPLEFEANKDLLLLNGSFIIGAILLGLIVGKLLKTGHRMGNSLILAFTFSNNAYLGIPLLAVVYGEDYLPAAGLIASLYLFLLFSVALPVIEINEKGKFRLFPLFISLLKNPLFIAVLLGLFFNLANIDLPEAALKSLGLLAQSVTAVVLLVIGIFIGHTPVGNISEWTGVIVLSALRLFILPGIFYLILLWTGKSMTTCAPFVLDAALPLAITPFALGEIYDLDRKFLARTTVLSTSVSIISIPIWITILG